MDVKFLIFKGKDGRKIKRYQYTAIDVATRVPGELFAKFQTSFYSDLADAALKASREECYNYV